MAYLRVGMPVLPPRRLHVHLSAEDIGAPRNVTPEAMDYVLRLAKDKFANDGWIVVEDDDHDLDITYDGHRFLIEAWVR